MRPSRLPHLHLIDLLLHYTCGMKGLMPPCQANRHFAWRGQVSVTIGGPVRYSNQDQPEGIAGDLAERAKAL